MAPPMKPDADYGPTTARSAASGSSTNSNNNGATGAVPKQLQQQQQQLRHLMNGAAGSAGACNASRSARSRRQQEHLGPPDPGSEALDFGDPLPRETLRTLNDLLQRTRIGNCKSRSPEDHQPPGNFTERGRQREVLRNLSAEQSDSAEQLQEQQHRYRFPVRPVQRVQHQPSAAASASATLLRLRQTTPPNATVGVVIPNATTSNGNGHCNCNGNDDNDNEEDHQQQQQPPGASLQNLVHRILSLPHSGTRNEAEGRSQAEVLRSLLELDENLNNRSQQSSDTLQINKMVHEINPNGEQEEGVVNSTSLEDVALSEMSDNRAQSIQSLHSVLETPTPDSAPSLDELQQRLEASNRNMQQLQDEQAKLMHIQNLAKSHLSEMETLRQHSGRLPHARGGGDAPNYESVHEVQEDMASLVGRMKNLTAFIHNQNELSSVLGDDGPEILAEQKALQDKLESLRTQRDDMRVLVDELNGINRVARETSKTIKEKSCTPPPKAVSARPALTPSPSAQAAAPASAKERMVPVQYQRNVPIIRQEAANAAQRALQAQAMINQKTADINTLKAQMAKLKSMLNTVTHLEQSTASAGSSLERRSEERNSLERSSVERELTADMAQRVFALKDVTSELRAEAASLQKERDRILALKAEIERRKQQAAAAVLMGEEALKRNSLTPTPTPSRQCMAADRDENEEPSEVDTSLQGTPTKEQLRDDLRLQCERLRKEYEQKQRELEQRYVANNQTTSEADDEGNDDTDSDRYFAHVRTASSATLKRAPSASTVVETRRGPVPPTLPPPLPLQEVPPPMTAQAEEEINATLETLSLGNDSLFSSSNRSQYMPPPMPPVKGMWGSHNNGNTWHGQQPVYGQSSSSIGAEFKPPPPPPQAGSSNTSGSNATPDPVLLQQFMQTQQMLINSVCQCNQTLWHQQREIDSLNNQLHTLQERLNVVACQDHSFGLRSESVPPPNLNNLCLGSARSQSEQLFNFGSHQSAFSNYQRSCHRSGGEGHLHQQPQTLPHQSQPFLNNAAPPQTTHFNNETPLSPPTYRASPGPIFMNHHNNTIHQNNANLRTQNQHANNLHPLSEEAGSGAGSGTTATLNNQVPPGNRANNYWDNFRSHSRQNLLTNKSNEEQNLDFQQYRRQRGRPSYIQAPPLLAPHTARSSSSGLTHQQQRRHFFDTPLTASQGSNSNNLNNSSTSGARNREWREELSVEARDAENADDLEENHDNVLYGSGRRRNRRRPLLATLRDEPSEQSSSSNLNMNVNSPLYQRNKVPAKPTTSAVSLTPIQQRHLRFDFELPAQYMDYADFSQAPGDGTPILGQDAASLEEESNSQERDGLDDAASEEMNRNLLVNALKNEKFTSKFYESIKEDIYRRLRMLFDQQQQHSSQAPQSLRKALNQDDTEPRPNPDTEATESSSESPMEAIGLQLEKDQAEVSESASGQDRDEAPSPTEVTLAGIRKQACVNQQPDSLQKAAKAEEEQSDEAAALDASALAPDHELIEYIIKRIRNQTHNNTVINDSLLAEVSKLTATAAQNSASTSSPLISPKRIYAKIKKMDMPRQRDEFLLWYRSYLEQLFVVATPGNSKPGNSKKPPARRPPQSQSQSQDSNNDADLAEADQKNSAPAAASGDLECENNENPGEEGDGPVATESTEGD
ncbi:hypothetical protein KR018_003462 [Drosophila ironensis]|nr:hypothetical protein KR018_003462 [Drosophila ironensis]